MRLNNTKYGTVELEIQHGRTSSVDSFIGAAYSETLDRELTDSEVEELNEEYTGEVQEYSYSEGFCANHN